MLRTVKLYGHLGKTFRKVWRLNVKSPAEAIRAIAANDKKFLPYLVKHSEPGYKVLVDNRELSKESLTHPPGVGTIKIIPVTVGASGDVFNIIVGIFLVAASFFAPGVIAIAGTGYGIAVAGTLATIGASLILTGVAGLLAPSPQSDVDERPENKPSYAFNGPVNTIGQGHPVPILYGKLLVGGQVISAGLSADNVSSELSG